MRTRILFFISLFMLALLGPMCVSAQQSNEQLASHYFNNGEFEQAAEMYQSLYKSTSNRYYYQMLLRSYVALSDFRSAEKLVDARLKRFPKELSLYVDLGDVLTRRGESKKAEKTLASAIDKLSYDPKQLSDLVMAYESAGRLDYAIRAYQYMRQKQNAPTAFVMELATLYERTGNYELMMQEYFSLLDAAPGNMPSIQIALQRALNQTSNPQLAEGLRKALVSRIHQDPANRQYADMMIWFSLQQKDFDFALSQAKAISSRFPEEGCRQVLAVAEIARSNQSFDVAAQGYAHVVQKGRSSAYYYDARVGVLLNEFERLNAQYSIVPAKLAQLEASYRSAFEELGKTPRTVPIMRNYAYVEAYYAHNVQAAADILYDILEMHGVEPSVVAEVKLELADLLLFAGEIWDASLLYMQVEKAFKDDRLGAMAKFKNAKLSYYNHDFQWAKSQLDVLRASTSKLIANNAMELSLLISDNMDEDSTYTLLEQYASADLLLFRNQLDSAWDAFDDITHRALSHPLFDEILLQKAKIRMRQSRYAEADSLLEKLFELYPDDILADDALILRGRLNEEQLSNPQRARECYERLIIDYPVSLYVDEARKRNKLLK